MGNGSAGSEAAGVAGEGDLLPLDVPLGLGRLFGGEDPIDRDLRRETQRLQLELLRRQLGIGQVDEYREFETLAAARNDYVVTGSRGGGKSTTAEQLARAYQAAGWRLERFGYGPGALKSFAAMPSHTVVLTDEAVLSLAHARGPRGDAELAELLALARHRDVSLIVVGQTAHQVPVEVFRHDIHFGVKETGLLASAFTRDELKDALTRARAALKGLPKRKGVTWWLAPGGESFWTENGALP